MIPGETGSRSIVVLPGTGSRKLAVYGSSLTAVAATVASGCSDSGGKTESKTKRDFMVTRVCQFTFGSTMRGSACRRSADGGGG